MKKGKARERGERPEQNFEGLKRITLAGGQIGWVIAEGEEDSAWGRRVD